MSELNFALFPTVFSITRGRVSNSLAAQTRFGSAYETRPSMREAPEASTNGQQNLQEDDIIRRANSYLVDDKSDQKLTIRLLAHVTRIPVFSLYRAEAEWSWELGLSGLKQQLTAE